MNKMIPSAKLAALLGLLFISFPLPLFAHIADEIAVKTTVEVNKDTVNFKFDISSGVLFSTAFLKTLDPDKNKIFEEKDILAFSEFFLKTLKVDFDGKTEKLSFENFTASEWDYFAAGVSTIILEYALVTKKGRAETTEAEMDQGGYLRCNLRYEFSFYPEIAVYSLSLVNNAPEEIAFLSEKRHEFLQDVLELQYALDPALAAAMAAERTRAAALLPISAAPEKKKPPLSTAAIREFIRSGFERSGIMDFIRGTGSRRIPVLLLILALGVGFLHAFTPGHGKALVGAFLIANQGTVLHAFCLGIVLTLTHTISIYGFGLLASTAAKVFLPGEFVPVLSVACGIFIIGIGIRSFIRRILGKETDHAHLLPNLRILERDTVNILIDGQAAEANEALMIAQDDSELQESLKAAGAENFTLCSPGCSAHVRLPGAIQERQRSEFFRMAIKTGAVDAVVAQSERTIKYIGKLGEKTFIQKSDAVVQEPRELLFSAVRNYASRGAITMPKTQLSWGRVISLGITGGIIPCPDALAVLLVATAAGKVGMGMGIIFLFSLGLAFALILVGMAIVLTKRLLAGQRRFALVLQSLPYFSSLFISALGVLMIKTSFI
ncbi:high-affinity nickel-transporter [Treponema primitia ZAS-2]|uniref:High-affinity nickel-transporter n=1 Tax=Treponema primitia (strain ATCC BAA-887 / DSM 12427 / ZAS-2) TaxID=545694 RepID=F5YIC9_TREPZ|nr:sulfite exporter TauE/SafE family protein [Treponema primitia]AEF85918.1 high-affinity nickel-transporter [Treponema primitia ZAS-2]